MEINSEKTFRNWYERASVRSGPRRIVDPDDKDLDIFPRALVPVVSHPIFQSLYLDRVSEFLALQLYRYLAFTINLELLVVNPNLLNISLAADEFKLNESERLAVHQMYVDEGYHALFCIDIGQQVSSMINVRPKFNIEPSFLNRLRELEQKIGDKKLAGLIFTAVSEMLITGSLTNVARNENNVPAVGRIMMDHAQDEARHHAFFKGIFKRINAYNPLKLNEVLEFVPEAIFAFIDPDIKNLKAALLQVGVSAAHADEILHDTYQDNIVVKHAKSSANDLISFLSREVCGKNMRLNEKLEASKLC